MSTFREDNAIIKLPRKDNRVQGWAGDVAWIRKHSNCHFCDAKDVDCVTVFGKTNLTLICFDCLDEIVNLTPESPTSPTK